MSSTNDNTYRPTKIKVSRLGVNISDEMNRNLNLDSSQYMIVGERYTNQGGNTSNTYALIADNEGIGVNMSIASRTANKNDYPTQLNGTVYVDGNIIVTGVVSGANDSNIIGGTSNFWQYAGNDNIYYGGKINIGQTGEAIDNTYSLNIVESANKNIQKSQFAIQNNQLSEFRTAILGDTLESPVIFNTTSATPIEFHVNRDKNYFDSVYSRPYWNAELGASNIELLDTPDYRISSNVPNMVIDIDGNVGIHTSTSHPFNYLQRKPNTDNPDVMDYNYVAEDMIMYVDGPMYTRDMLVYDYESGGPKSLDDLYIRTIGETILACNVIPGQFRRGVFKFTSNTCILTDNESAALNVGGDINCEDDIVCDNITAYNDGTFNNNVTVQNNIYFKSNLYKQVLNVETGSNEWALIEMDNNTITNASVSNIYYIGDGIATSGRLGVGVHPSNDEVNHQQAIRKRDSTIYELELMDRSSPYVNKTAWIGHPKVASDKERDASLTFVTPSSTHPNYNLYHNNSLQNIYFFPGYEEYLSRFELTSCNLPTLGIFEGGKVGILTYEPEEALDVHGNIRFDGSLYYNSGESIDPIKLGIWKARDYSLISQGPGTHKGIEYSDTAAPHVGINTVASADYGLVVSGKLKSINGYYTNDNYKISPWYSSLLDDGVSLPNTQKQFTIGRVGIGMRLPSSTLHIKDDSSTSHLKISQSSFNASTLLQIEGNNNSYMFHLDDNKNILELFEGPSDELYTSANNRPLIIRNDAANSHQIIVNSNQDMLSEDINNSLIVNGNVKVYGDLDITGEYKLSGGAITVTNSQVEYNLEGNNTQDIIITGQEIFINPDQTQSKHVFIGYNQDKFEKYDTANYAPFNVLQSRDLTVATSKFSSVGNSTEIQFENIKDDKKINIGVNNTNDFIVYDKKNNKSASPILAATGNKVGFGTNTNKNNSMINIFNDSAASGIDTLRITKKSTTDGSNVAPGVTLHKLISDSDYEWKIVGPEESFKQKLRFVYKDPTVEHEPFTFTSNGLIGIGNTNPEFAIDINANSSGCIRMFQPETSTAKPQLLFQSGSNEYGADNATDFRLYSYNKDFHLDMEDQLNGLKPLFHFTSNKSLGIHQTADSEYNVSIDGTLNVSDKIYLNGTEVFSVTTDVQGTALRGENVIIMPDTSVYGGVSLNFNSGTSNLFYVKSGNDGNMMVLDSEYNESQINFRVKDDTNNKRLYRLAASNESFIVEYSSNNVFSGEAMSDSHDGYLRVVELMPSVTNNFDMVLDANVRFNKSDDPNIYMNNTTIGHSNEILYVLDSYGVGIGTKVSDGILHVHNNNIDKPTVYIQSSSEVDMMQIVQEEIVKLVVDYSGNLGVGTTTPIAPIHVNASGGSTDPRNNGLLVRNDTDSSGEDAILSLQVGGSSAGNPYISFDADGDTPGWSIGMDNSDNNKFKISNAWNSLSEPTKVTIDSNGNVGIGTSSPLADLQVYSSNNDSVLSLMVTGDEIKDSYISFNSNELDGWSLGMDTSDNNKFKLSYQIDGLADSTYMTVNSNGYIGMANTEPSKILDINGNMTISYLSSQSDPAVYVDGVSVFTSNVYMQKDLDIANDIYIHGNTIQDSDRRIKYDIEPIENSLDKIKLLTGCTFSKMNNDRRHTGLIAQDVQNVLPEAVYTQDNGILGIDYGNMMGLIVEGIKSLSDKVDELKSLLK
jgi:hypothetical protein